MYDDLKKEVVDIQQEISNLRKNELTELRKNNSNLNAELQHIKTQVNNLQQEKLRCKAICFGLPFVQKENIKNSIDNLLAKYKITSNGLNNCRRAQAKNTKKKGNPPVILIFNDFKSRDELLAKCKNVVLDYEDYDPTLSNTAETSSAIKNRSHKIYFKELLTSDTKKLLDATKAALSDKVKYIWYTNGKILVKKKEGDPASVVNNPDQIQRLLEELYSSA